MKRIIVGMSGGVDSSVAAYLLIREGYEVIGVFMKNWNETDENGVCSAQDDYEDARSVCLKLKIPFYSVDFSQEYWDNVFTYFLEEYQRGRTPNPDVLCNSEIKFKYFLNYARDTFGADYMATGHYVRRGVGENGESLLLRGSDPGKDQSYFLSLLTSEQLEGALFPIGDMVKREVREIAGELGLRTAAKKDSTGICFIGERNFRKFLNEYIPAMPGDIVDIDTNQKVGEHKGLMFYTIAQRRGLGIGNLGGGERWYVAEKDMDHRILYVAQGQDNPKLLSNGFVGASRINFIGQAPREALRCRVKYRYRQEDHACEILYDEKLGRIQVLFDEAQIGVAPGQVGVFYDGERCLGGAVIDDVLK
jgi:tRNA-specific 2-thiouridylase